MKILSSVDESIFKKVNKNDRKSRFNFISNLSWLPFNELLFPVIGFLEIVIEILFLFKTSLRKEIVKFHIEDGTLYLLQEAEPLLSREAFKDLLQISYHINEIVQMYSNINYVQLKTFSLES